MGTLELSKRDRDAEPEILAALRAHGVEIDNSEWKHIPQLEQWQLFIKTPFVRSHGEVEALRTQNDALMKAGIDTDIASRVRLEREWRKKPKP
jgi:aryl carrier-like protein